MIDPAPDLPDRTFEAVYRRHHRDVLRYTALMLRNVDEAGDVTADVFARAFAAWREGRGPAGDPLPWLLLIARRIVLDRWRRRRLLRWLPLRHEAAPAATSPASTTEVEFWIWLDRLAAALPDRQREVLFLRYRRDLSDDDIGLVMGLSPSGVRSLAARAIAGLRNHPELLA